MEIVFLDSISVGEDINLESLKKNGDLILYKLTNKNEVFDRIKNSEIIITNKVYIGKEQMEKAPKLKLICIAATGYNNVDLNEAKKRGIIVANVKNYSTESVAQTVFSYIFTLYNCIEKYDEDVKKGEWSKSPIFTLLKYPVKELRGKTLGILGYGAIGKRIEEIAKVFNMKILIGKMPNREYIDNTRLELNEVLEKSDIITIHCPLTKETENLISKKELSLMKKDSILINTARGKIVNENALYNSLKNKEIGAAAIDVMDLEPPEIGNKLFELENIIISPHIAWASKESREALISGIVKNIDEYLAGNGIKIDLGTLK